MMTDEGNVSSFIDQIVQQTLDLVSKHSEFDESTLERIRQLFRSGDVTKYQRVVEALSTNEGDPP